jgi:hypothetical protein
LLFCVDLCRLILYFSAIDALKVFFFYLICHFLKSNKALKLESKSSQYPCLKLHSSRDMRLFNLIIKNRDKSLFLLGSLLLVQFCWFLLCRLL